ncbi:MAG: hypothetical protein M3298_08765 [Thermoproteota archaeon]|nr:hypothetical protein [Thermoproteota archaeon]
MVLSRQLFVVGMINVVTHAVRSYSILFTIDTTNHVSLGKSATGVSRSATICIIIHEPDKKNGLTTGTTATITSASTKGAVVK